MKFNRLPNGFGTILHLKGKLRNPYIAKKRIGTKPDGKPIWRTVGTYPTRSEAFDALTMANRLDLPPEDTTTFAELYDRFRTDVLTMPVNGRHLSASSINGYGFAYKAVSHLHSRPFLALTAPELQDALRIAGGSASKQSKIKLLFSKMYQYAQYLGVADQNLADLIHVTTTDHPERHPFSLDEVKAIWQMPQNRWRDCTLIMLYTGMRVGELFTVHDINDCFFRAGLKTEAGINRLIPIHPEIADLVHRTLPVYGEPNLIQHWFRRNIHGHTPQDCRRTFTTRADECEMNPTACRQIVGHSSGDVHVTKYTMHPPEFLYQEMTKLNYDNL